MPDAEPIRLVVDHCQASKRVRGLLCGRCDAGLGGFRGNPELLMAAARHLLGEAVAPPVREPTRAVEA